MSTTPNNDYSRISPYTLEEFNTLLEENKPYTKDYFKLLRSNTIITLKDTSLDYIPEFKILFCSEYKFYIENSTNTIVKHFKVSIFYLY